MGPRAPPRLRPDLVRARLVLDGLHKARAHLDLVSYELTNPRLGQSLSNQPLPRHIVGRKEKEKEKKRKKKEKLKMLKIQFLKLKIIKKFKIYTLKLIFLSFKIIKIQFFLLIFPKISKQ